MKSVARILAALLACVPVAASAETDVDQLTAAMKVARWTGPLLASNAETLPQGHVYTEPYFFDGILGGEHHPGTSGFYQYGLTDSWTVGVQPFFSLGAERFNHDLALGDFKLLSQVRLSHFTPERQVPSVALVTNLVIPTGKDDHLGRLKSGHGSGSFAPEIGVNVQQYFLLGNGRLLRARINVLQRFPYRAEVTGRSVYGTDVNFRGHAKPGTKTTLITAVEYSLTNEWVLAMDVEGDFFGGSRVEGHEGSGGPLVRTTTPASRDVGFSPAVEYNWSPSTGALLGVWIIPKGHNSPASVTPAIAISKFW